MAKPLGSVGIPVASAAVAAKQLASSPSSAERRPHGASERFLVAVPAEPEQVDAAVKPAVLRPSTQGDSRSFELTAASSRAVVTECLKRAQAHLSLSLAGREACARVIATHGLDLVLALDALVPDGICTARCDLYDVPFLLRGQLHFSEIDADAGAGNSAIERHAVLSKVRIYTLDERRGTRVPLGKGQGSLHWARVVAGAPQIVQSALLDLTPSGAGIELTASDPAPPSEPFVGELQFGNVKIPLLANVQWRVQGREIGLAGLRFEAGLGKRKLVDLHLKQRFPALVPRAEVNREKLAELLGESGYLKLREGEGPSPAWHRYRSDHSIDLVYQAQDGKLLGHVSITRSYKRTWLMHQLATLSGHAESSLCRQTLYGLGSCAPTAFDGEQAYALAYFNRKRRWHQLFFEQFAEWLNNEALGTISVFERFERAPDAGPSGTSQLDSRYSIEALREEDLVSAVALIRAQLSPLVADALDIHPQDLQCSGLNDEPQRSRTALVLRGQEGLLGVALCETGPTSASLFNMFNLAQFYFCTGSARPAVDAQLGLLSAVRNFYQERGTASPLIVAPPGSFAADQEPGTTLVESMGCVVFSSFGLRQYEHYCRLQMGKLYQRKAPPRQPQRGAHDRPRTRDQRGAQDQRGTHDQNVT